MKPWFDKRKVLRMHTKKMEFSKKVLILVAVVTIIVIAYTLVMVAVTRDLTPLNYLIPALFGEVATGTGFYYWKAKQENMIKLRQSQDKTQIQSGCVSPEEENFETFDAPQI